MADITDIIDYYVNLLIIQYHNQPKAMATIQLFAQELLASGILLDIQNAYDVDTAVGVQLDVIGKYVGVTRYYSQVELINYFSLETYTEPAPSSPPRWGFCTYATYGNNAYNGTLIYPEIIAPSNVLSDADYRVLIKFKIWLNASDFSHKDIDQRIFDFFRMVVRPETNGNMSMAYFLTPPLSTVILAILFKHLLPRPMAVGSVVVNNVTGNMFAMTDYTGYMSPFGYGFSTYSNYDTLAGQDLIYDQIAAG